MYLSKIIIHGARSNNPYEIHKALWSLFPLAAKQPRDFLFRTLHSDYAHAEILMQSIRPPELKGDMTRVLACKEFSLTLQLGQRLRFLLVANPIKTIDDESRRLNSRGELKKCRVPLVREEEQHIWITRKFQGIAELEETIIEPRLPIKFRKERENRAGKIQPVSFLGIIMVKNADGLSELVRDGIGPGKAFGCGLLSLARA